MSLSCVFQDTIHQRLRVVETVGVVADAGFVNADEIAARNSAPLKLFGSACARRIGDFMRGTIMPKSRTGCDTKLRTAGIASRVHLRLTQDMLVVPVGTSIRTVRSSTLPLPLILLLASRFEIARDNRLAVLNLRWP